MKLENEQEYMSTLKLYKEVRQDIVAETEAIRDVATALDENEGNLSSMISIMFELEDDLIEYEKRNNKPITIVKTPIVFNDGQFRGQFQRVCAMAEKYRTDLTKTTDEKQRSSLEECLARVEELLREYKHRMRQTN